MFLISIRLPISRSVAFQQLRRRPRFDPYRRTKPTERPQIYLSSDRRRRPPPHLPPHPPVVTESRPRSVARSLPALLQGAHRVLHHGGHRRQEPAHVRG